MQFYESNESDEDNRDTLSSLNKDDIEEFEEISIPSKDRKSLKCILKVRARLYRFRDDEW